MFCPKCNKKNPDDANFCMGCSSEMPTLCSNQNLVDAEFKVANEDGVKKNRIIVWGSAMFIIGFCSPAWEYSAIEPLRVPDRMVLGTIAGLGFAVIGALIAMVTNFLKKDFFIKYASGYFIKNELLASIFFAAIALRIVDGATLFAMLPAILYFSILLFTPTK